MWGNFRNVGTAMKALGNVVAPPLEDDDDDDDDEYYDDYVDEQDDELEEADDIDSTDDDDIVNEGAPPSAQPASPLKKYGFGLVGMIAGALEQDDDVDDEGDYDDDEYYDEDDNGEEVVELYRDETPDVTAAATEPPPPPQTSYPMQEDDAGQFTPPPSDGAATPPRHQPQEDDGWDDIHTTWEQHGNAAVKTKNAGDSTDPLPPNVMNGGKMEQRRSIQRETGSVSPIVSSSKRSLQSSPNDPASKQVAGPSTEAMVTSLQGKLPDLFNDTPESTAPIISASAGHSTSIPETEAPAREYKASPLASSHKSATPSEQRPEEPQGRRSSKVSLSDARFMAEVPRSEVLELSDRWEAPKSRSMKQKKSTSSKDGNNATNSGHSVDSYFDDSSLSSKSSNGRLGGGRKARYSRSAPAAPTSRSDHPHMHTSAPSPALGVPAAGNKEDKGRKSQQKAKDRFRAEPARPVKKELLSGDARFASSRSQVAPPPEPQRQASKRLWSNGSSKDKAESTKANVVATPGHSAEFEGVVSEGAVSRDPPRTPRRRHSGEQTPPTPEDGPRRGKRPPLVAGNSKDGDVLPRRPVQRMHSLTEEKAGSDSPGHVQSDPKVNSASNDVSIGQRASQSVDELQKKCRELEKRLKEENEAKQVFEQKWKQEESARETMVNAFTEKEARLFDAATESQEQTVRELNAEMERRVEEVSTLLEDQMKQHEADRAEWQELLNEAEDKIDALQKGRHGEDETQLTEHLSSVMEDQQRKHERDRSEWQELFSKMEKEIEELKAEQKQDKSETDTSEHTSILLEQQQKQHEQERKKWQELLNEAETKLEEVHKEKEGKEDSDVSGHVSSTTEDQERQREEDDAEWQELLNQAEHKLEVAQEEKRDILAQLESSRAQNQEQEGRAVRMAEDKLAQTLAMVDERDEQIAQLKNMIQSMNAEVNEHREGVQEVEDEADELRHQNEVLKHRLETTQAECSELNEELSRLQSETDKMANLKMELRLLKEDRQRERAKSQSVAESASSNTAKLSSDRDAALAEANSLRQQLAAAQADIEIAQQDAARAQKASENLQMALESIQGEREAELNLLEDQRRSLEESMAASHAAALEATHEANEARIREVQAEAHAQVDEAQAETKKIEEKLESFRTENVQMRRSLDEAISRLQHNQEDVIDRALMKNILLDWLTKHGNKEKRQVLELMASVLHFTDEEKARVHIGGEEFSLGKVVATVTAPPPPSKADVEHLEGTNVREKWVSFLLAETDD